MRTFEFRDGNSAKFWNITLQGTRHTVNYGKIGSKGQTTLKDFPTQEQARIAHDKIIAEKLAKGYVETSSGTPAPAPGISPLEGALEAAILADPNDRLAHSAYADYLSEQSDPQLAARGEFISLQLRLDDGSLPAAERKKLQKREKELLAAHGERWVGDWAELAPYDGPEGRGQLDFREPRPARFVRGILAEVVVARLTVNCARALARAPQTRLVRNLAVGGYDYEDTFDPGPDVPADLGHEEPAAHALRALPQLPNLRSFQLGWTADDKYGDFCHLQCHLSGPSIHDAIRRMPLLEELYLFAHGVDTHQIFSFPMPHLRVLQVYHTWEYDLPRLAANPSLTRLTHFLCHPHVPEGSLAFPLAGLRAVVRSPHLKSLTHLRLRLTAFGDEGVQEIIDSGILKRLKVLDLRHGRVSDAGATALAECPEAKGLELLDLSRNELTRAGIAALTNAGLRVQTQHQHERTAEGPTAEGDYQDFDDLMEMEFMMEGDYE
jgi:uncharacterized protein (TIGR02996 family)